MKTLFRILAFAFFAAFGIVGSAQNFLVEVDIPGCTAQQFIGVEVQNSASVIVMSASGQVDGSTCSFVQNVAISTLPDDTYSVHITSYCSNAVLDATDQFVVSNGEIPFGYYGSFPCSGGIQLDCLGVPNGPNIPGTPCDDGLANTDFDTWLPNCLCIGIPDTTNYTDCAGILNGPDVPGQACDDGNPNTTGELWNWNCECVVLGVSPCSAGLFITQAYGLDSVEIPNELWVLNTSTGGSGTYTALWNFDDGTTSTEDLPTHVYATNGPYILCLTIDDGAGCTDTYCDTLLLDADGMYDGLVAADNRSGDRNGFTIRVLQQLPVGIVERDLAMDLVIAPNPVTDALTFAFTNRTSNPVQARILDVNGRVVMQVNGAMPNGRVQHTVHVGHLNAGLYQLQISDGNHMRHVRFVKQ
jgi:hypothetical protein